MQPSFLKPVLTVMLALFAFYGIPVQAARDYNIELVIFKYSGVDQYNAEHWPDHWRIPDTLKSVDLKKIPAEYRSSIMRTGSNALTLNNVVKTLDESSRYQVLTHLGWRQPGLNKDDAINIKIQAGQVYRRITPLPEPLIVENTENQETMPATGSLFITTGDHEPGLPAEPGKPVPIEYEAVTDTTGTSVENPVYELSGNFMVVISRFIHVYADLLLMEPVTLKLEETAPLADAYTNTDSETLVETPKYHLIYTQPDLSFTTLQGFNIREHRRMRSDELHFIDHPARYYRQSLGCT